MIDSSRRDRAHVKVSDVSALYYMATIKRLAKTAYSHVESSESSRTARRYKHDHSPDVISMSAQFQYSEMNNKCAEHRKSIDQRWRTVF